MLYKCDNCKYTTQRACDLRRHQARKYPCNRHSKDKGCNNVERQNVNVGIRDLNADTQIVNADVRDLNDDREIQVQTINAEVQNINAEVQRNTKDTPVMQCEKCNKQYLSKRRYKQHIANCTGLHLLQCAICLKMFASPQGKSQHKRYVKCSPPSTTTSESASVPSTSGVNIQGDHNTVNNISVTNNVTNNNINIVRNDFYKISEEDIDRIVEKLGEKEYFKLIMSNLDMGKYAIPRTVESIYFNDKFPDLQIIKKERRNDKMVDVYVGEGRWEKRMIDDIFKLVVRRVEEYHSKYFRHLEEKYKNVPVGSVRWKQLMRPIKSFGNCMLWYDGFRGDAIECLGIELNYPDEEDPDIEKERERRIREMERLLGEKVYEESVQAKRAEAITVVEE